MARKTILIADDDAKLAPVLALHLRNEYYGVAGAIDAAEALQRLAAAPPPDLVILSATLPGDGGATDPSGVAECRERCQREAIPVIYLADDRRSRRMQRFLEDLEGDTPVLRKPFATSDLLTLVSSMLRRRVAAA